MRTLQEGPYPSVHRSVATCGRPEPGLEKSTRLALRCGCRSRLGVCHCVAAVAGASEVVPELPKNTFNLAVMESSRFAGIVSQHRGAQHRHKASRPESTEQKTSQSKSGKLASPAGPGGARGTKGQATSVSTSCRGTGATEPEHREKRARDRTAIEQFPSSPRREGQGSAIGAPSGHVFCSRWQSTVISLASFVELGASGSSSRAEQACESRATGSTRGTQRGGRARSGPRCRPGSGGAQEPHDDVANGGSRAGLAWSQRLHTWAPARRKLSQEGVEQVTRSMATNRAQVSSSTTEPVWWWVMCLMRPLDALETLSRALAAPVGTVVEGREGWGRRWDQTRPGQHLETAQRYAHVRFTN